MPATEGQHQASPYLPLALCGVALPVMLARHSDLPVAAVLQESLSLSPLTGEAAGRIVHLLTVPLGALIVAFFRLTLGLRMLGPFRPILIAVALYHTGLAIGTTLVLITMLTVLMVRPRIASSAFPYFARLSILLVCVVITMIAALMAASALDLLVLERAVFFPIVVLVLTADGFARVLGKEGLGSAMWRGGITLLVALLINAMIGIPSLRASLLQYPELLLVELAGILLIAGRFRKGTLAFLNPPRRRGPVAGDYENGESVHDVPESLIEPASLQGRGRSPSPGGSPPAG